QDDRAEQAGQETEEPARRLDVEEQAEHHPADQAADDADGDVEEQSLLLVGAHDLAADPPGQSADDAPAEETQGKHRVHLASGAAASAAPSSPRVMYPPSLTDTARYGTGTSTTGTPDTRIVPSRAAGRGANLDPCSPPRVTATAPSPTSSPPCSRPWTCRARPTGSTSPARWKGSTGSRCCWSTDSAPTSSMRTGNWPRPCREPTGRAPSRPVSRRPPR